MAVAQDRRAHMKFPIDLGHRSGKEIIAFIMIFTVCGVIVLVVVTAMIRPPSNPQTGERIYRLLDTMIGVIAGVIGGSAGTYALTKKNGEVKKDEKP